MAQGPPLAAQEPPAHLLNEAEALSCELPEAICSAPPDTSEGHTKKEVMRVLKRHLGNVIYRRITRDLTARLETPALDAEAA